MVVYNFLDIRDPKQFIKIYELLCPAIVVDSIILGRNNADRLVIVHQEKLWLFSESYFVIRNYFYFFSLKIQLNHFIMLGKNDSGRIFSRSCELELKLHSNLCKFRLVFDHNSFH